MMKLDARLLCVVVALFGVLCCQSVSSVEEVPDTYAGVEVDVTLDPAGMLGAEGKDEAFKSALGDMTVERSNPGEALEFSVTLSKGDAPASFWHDIPAIAQGSLEEEGPLVVNFVPEIQRGQIGKLEIIKDIDGNPVKFDRKDVKDSEGEVLYERPRYVAYGASPFIYGAIPQTWENSLAPDPITNITGDNDPIDALDIGSVVPGVGAAYEAKVLGTLGLIDDEETDWKVILINAMDPEADKYNSIEDVPEETKEMIFTYFRDKPVAVGDAPGKFWPKIDDAYTPDVWFSLEDTKDILSHTKQAYADLIADCSKVEELEFAYAGCKDEGVARLNAAGRKLKLLSASS